MKLSFLASATWTEIDLPLNGGIADGVRMQLTIHENGKVEYRRWRKSASGVSLHDHHEISEEGRVTY